MTRHAWIDASAGIAGDMLLGALVDAGASIEQVRKAVEAVIPGAVRIDARSVTRAGQHAIKIDIVKLRQDQPVRHWSEIRSSIEAAEVSEPTRARALAAFSVLAEAEAAVHDVAVDDVHFHEVGAWDSIADIVGVAAALDDLEVAELSAGPIAVGSGRVRTAHGELSVPVPAVVRLAVGWSIAGGGKGELTTPTGMALIAGICVGQGDLPGLRLAASGSGAGSKDPTGRANVTRVLIGDHDRVADDLDHELVLLETNIDDLDPRIWPGVLQTLITAGAADAWLTPILMKKGRPAHTLAVLAQPGNAAALQELIMVQTSTFGVRRTLVRRAALPRGWVDVDTAYGVLPIKIAHRDDAIIQATPEYDDLEQAAQDHQAPAALVLDAAHAAVISAGLAPGRAVPAGLRNGR